MSERNAWFLDAKDIEENDVTIEGPAIGGYILERMVDQDGTLISCQCSPPWKFIVRPKTNPDTRRRLTHQSKG